MQERPKQYCHAGTVPDASPFSPARQAMLSKLFRDHNQALINFLLTHLSSEHEAHEVAQEAYVKLLQLDRPEAIGFLRAYLFRIAANLAIDRLRRGSCRARIEILDASEEYPVASSVEREVLAEQEIALLRQAITELEPRWQHALIQHRFRDMPVADIALEMGVSGRTVRTYVARALLYCRLRLDGHASESAAMKAKELVP